MDTIKQGYVGKDTVRLCQLLKVPNSFEYIPELVAKVKEFQKENNLVSDGIVGPKTWLTLFVLNRLRNTGDEPGICDYDYFWASEYLGCDVASIRAVLDVETSGSGFVAPEKPVILFEGHIFWKELKSRGIDPEKYSSKYPGIVYPKWTKQYYLGGIREYERFELASKISKDSAIESVSVGLFQILGQNYKACSCSNQFEFWDKMCESEFSQFVLGIEFIRNQDLGKYLASHDWVRFAERYNGPLQAQNKYSDKLEKAWKKYNNNK